MSDHVSGSFTTYRCRWAAQRSWWLGACRWLGGPRERPLASRARCSWRDSGGCRDSQGVMRVVTPCVLAWWSCRVVRDEVAEGGTGRQSLLPNGQLSESESNCTAVARDGRRDRDVAGSDIDGRCRGREGVGCRGSLRRASEVRIGAWDEAGSLTRAEMRRRLSPSSDAPPASCAPIWTTRGLLSLL